MTATAAKPEAVAVRAPRTRVLLGRISRGILRNPGALVGLIIILTVVLAAIFADQLSPADPLRQQIVRRLRPPSFLAENSTFLLGSDSVGRDILSRILHGARISLALSLTTVLLGTFIGVAAGLVAGVTGGWIETIIMRLVDATLALPFIVVAIAIIAVLGPGLPQLITLLTLFVWAPFARLVRGDVLAARQKEYIEAARGLGASRARIAVFHLLPNVISPVIVLATFQLANLIIVESALSFLGLGVPPPTPTWGGILSDGRGYIDTAWWLSVFPGLAITLTVMGFNFLGDALRDVLDPRQQV